MINLAQCAFEETQPWLIQFDYLLFCWPLKLSVY